MQVETIIEQEFSAERAADFLRFQGRHVVKTESCWWYNAYGQKHIYYSFPPNRVVAPSSDEIKQVFRSAPGAKAVRYLSPATAGTGKEGYIWTCRQPYSLQTLEHKARNQVRQGLKNCQVRAITLAELQALGARAHADTMKRLGIETGELKFGKPMQDNPAYEAWGAFVEDNLAAYIVTLRIEDWVYIQINRSVKEYLKHRPNNALVYTVISELLARPGISTVSYGWGPLYELDTLDHFKLGMGSVKEPVRQCAILTYWLRPILPSFVCRTVEKLSELRGNDHRLKQIAGICRLVRETSA